MPPSRPFWHTMTPIAPCITALDNTARPKLRSAWTRPGRFEIRGPAPEGKVISVQICFADRWRAWQDGMEAPVESDGMGFVVVKARPSADSTIVLEYRAPAVLLVFDLRRRPA